MSAAKKVDLLRPMNVSARDQAIYQAVVIGGKSQRSVALEYKLSPPRVSAILKRVTRWLSQGDPPGLDEIYRRDRLRVVSRLHRMRLDQLYLEAVEAWHKSDQTTHTLKEKVVKGEVVSQERQVQTRLRDQRYLREICAIADRIVGFEGFDARGNVDESCNGRVYEEPERSRVDSCREVKRRTILGGFDTPGDEGIPGMWEKEMRQRNAEVGVQRVEGRRDAGDGRLASGNSHERQQGASSLSAVLRGEDRGEGPARREDQSSSEKESQTTVTTPPKVPQHFCGTADQTPTQLLTNNPPVSAQVSQPPAVTKSTGAEKSLMPTPPKVRRGLLMGTAAEMAEALSFDEYFSPEARLARAFAAADARQQGQPLTPALSPEYRGEGVVFSEQGRR